MSACGRLQNSLLVLANSDSVAQSMEKFYGHCQQQQEISHAWIACLRSWHLSLFICRCSESEQARHLCRAGIPEPDAEHNSHAAQYAESQYCLLDPMWAAGGHCDGSRSRSVHSRADSAGLERLLWWRQVVHRNVACMSDLSPQSGLKRTLIGSLSPIAIL